MESDAREWSTTELFDRFSLPNYGRFPLTMVRGEGTRLWDEEGREYLDFTSGVAVCSLGHCHPRQVEAIREQATRLIHCSNLFRIRGQGELARRLTETVMGIPGKVFFCNSGAEANDALIKLARRYGHAVPGPEGPRGEIITLGNSFHGRTLGGIAATAQPKVKEGFDPLLPGFVHVTYNDLAAVRAAVTPQTGAILLEPIQGEGGINVAEPAFVHGLVELCRERDLLLMFDEVQCGIGRAGNWCGWRAIEGLEDVRPDAVSWAKGLGGGFPIGAIWASSERFAVRGGEKVCVSELLGPGSHGSTFGGNPLACAAAGAVIDEIEASGLCAHATALGERIIDEVRGWNLRSVRDVRGRGLLIGIELEEPGHSRHAAEAPGRVSPALHVIQRLMKEGLLTVAAGPRVVRLLPPLTVSVEEVDRALAMVHEVLLQLEREEGTV